MEQDFIEYNHIVDDILQISPPYQADSTYAPQYLAPDAKPSDFNAKNVNLQHNLNNAERLSFANDDKILEKPPVNKFTMLMHERGLMPDKKRSSSIINFNELVHYPSGSNNFEYNKQISKGLGNMSNIMNSFQEIYNIDENEAPREPSSLKIDSLFRNNQNSNSFLRRPEVIKPSQMLSYKNTPSGFSNKSFDLMDMRSREITDKSPQNMNKNQSQIYLDIQKTLANNSDKYLKINIDELQKDDDDEKILEQTPEINNLNSRNSSIMNIIKQDPVENQNLFQNDPELEFKK